MIASLKYQPDHMGFVDATPKEIKMMRRGGFEIEGAIDMVLPVLVSDIKELWPNGNTAVRITVEPLESDGRQSLKYRNEHKEG